jgi:hypothetical protein
MPLNEIVTSLHLHTTYSDGEFSHAQIAEAAMGAGVDCVIVTDHNVWVKGPERYYTSKDKKVLMLVGEEVHHAARLPQKSHMLIFGAGAELASHAAAPQQLIDAASQASALTFLAHPYEREALLFHEPDISWDNWEVTGFTGLELWNYMSEFKGLLTTKANTMRYAFNPETGIMGPYAETLGKWDELTAAGRKVVAVGGADAHGTTYQMGGIKRVIFPYDFLFHQVTTHLLTDTPLTGAYEADRGLVLNALARGHCFVGYDGAAPTRGFRFTANSEAGNLKMGDEVLNRNGVTMQIAVPTQPGMPRRSAKIPVRVSIHLIRNGSELAHWENQTNITHIVPPQEAGTYRVEVRLRYQGQLRGWIYSNPLYLKAP